eukprot:TRINITY_DN742_c0_g1_i19.p1 TRINITY_DN742_c0_g1~~TRINITY_DN742_c0_g1_i19.p1  ORF type:complete len:1189 (-),score=237.47 TRINITY_DN742_c0_g1_i19:768-4334(-)
MSILDSFKKAIVLFKSVRSDLQHHCVLCLRRIDDVVNRRSVCERSKKTIEGKLPGFSFGDDYSNLYYHTGCLRRLIDYEGSYFDVMRSDEYILKFLASNVDSDGISDETFLQGVVGKISDSEIFTSEEKPRLIQFLKGYRPTQKLLEEANKVNANLQLEVKQKGERISWLDIRLGAFQDTVNRMKAVIDTLQMNSAYFYQLCCSRRLIPPPIYMPRESGNIGRSSYSDELALVAMTFLLHGAPVHLVSQLISMFYSIDVNVLPKEDKIREWNDLLPYFGYIHIGAFLAVNDSHFVVHCDQGKVTHQNQTSICLSLFFGATKASIKASLETVKLGLSPQAGQGGRDQAMDIVRQLQIIQAAMQLLTKKEADEVYEKLVDAMIATMTDAGDIHVCKRLGEIYHKDLDSLICLEHIHDRVMKTFYQLLMMHFEKSHVKSELGLELQKKAKRSYSCLVGEVIDNLAYMVSLGASGSDFSEGPGYFGYLQENHPELIRSFKKYSSNRYGKWIHNIKEGYKLLRSFQDYVKQAGLKTDGKNRHGESNILAKVMEALEKDENIMMDEINLSAIIYDCFYTPMCILSKLQNFSPSEMCKMFLRQAETLQKEDWDLSHIQTEYFKDLSAMLPLVSAIPLKNRPQMDQMYMYCCEMNLSPESLDKFRLLLLDLTAESDRGDPVHGIKWHMETYIEKHRHHSFLSSLFLIFKNHNRDAESNLGTGVQQQTANNNVGTISKPSRRQIITSIGVKVFESLLSKRNIAYAKSIKNAAELIQGTDKERKDFFLKKSYLLKLANVEKEELKFQKRQIGISQKLNKASKIKLWKKLPAKKETTLAKAIQEQISVYRLMQTLLPEEFGDYNLKTKHVNRKDPAWEVLKSLIQNHKFDMVERLYDIQNELEENSKPLIEVSDIPLDASKLDHSPVFDISQHPSVSGSHHNPISQPIPSIAIPSVEPSSISESSQKRQSPPQPNVLEPDWKKRRNGNAPFNGLVNAGTDCFANSLLQCLLDIPDVYDRLRETENDWANLLCSIAMIIRGTAINDNSDSHRKLILKVRHELLGEPVTAYMQHDPEEMFMMLMQHPDLAAITPLFEFVCKVDHECMACKSASSSTSTFGCYDVCFGNGPTHTIQDMWTSNLTTEICKECPNPDCDTGTQQRFLKTLRCLQVIRYHIKSLSRNVLIATFNLSIIYQIIHDS